jgi:putative tryptophan/tyrosine transport system substrate-binding protein
MRRREFITLVGAAALTYAPAALAQRKNWRLGWLDPNPPPSPGRPYRNLDAFKGALAELGYVEGRDYGIEGKFADTDNSRLPTLASELVARGVDIIVTIGTPSVTAAKNATTMIPIVMAGSADPVEHGLVESIRHPGGNITGVTHSPGPEFAGKGLELLKETAPYIARPAVLWDSSAVHEELSLDAQRAVAAKLGLTLVPHDVKDIRSGDDLSALFSALTQEGADALFVFPNFVNGKYARSITNFASANRLPAMYQDTSYIDIGGLISYYTNWVSLRRRAAAYVDKIIKGAKPSDLPVEEPATFQLVVNLKAAKKLGLTIPAAVLARADEVIE